jgi:hypothetical protein
VKGPTLSMAILSKGAPIAGSLTATGCSGVDCYHHVTTVVSGLYIQDLVGIQVSSWGSTVQFGRHNFQSTPRENNLAYLCLPSAGSQSRASVLFLTKRLPACQSHLYMGLKSFHSGRCATQLPPAGPHILVV